jgi:hypothetical protein
MTNAENRFSGEVICDSNALVVLLATTVVAALATQSIIWRWMKKRLRLGPTITRVTKGDAR